MYSGLFGDLPAAKGGSGQDGTPANGGGEDGGDGSNKNDGSNRNSQNIFDGNQQQQRERPLPNSLNDSTAGSTTSSKSSSLMQSIGTAGTSMAFVPSAALKKKRKQPQENPQQKTQQSQLQKSFNDDDISKNRNDGDTKEIGAPIENIHNVPSKNSTAGAINNGLISKSAVRASEKASIATPSNTTMTIIRKSQSSTMAPSQQDRRQLQQRDHDDNLVGDRREEKEYVDEEITDPYDPYVPNDLLQYWEHQAAKLDRIELQRQAEEARKTQQLIRKRLEQERQKPQHPISSNHAATTVPSAARIAAATAGGRNFLIKTEGNVGCNDSAGLRGLGRGRGRGVSNLPAWLVEKQRKEAQANLSGARQGTGE